MNRSPYEVLDVDVAADEATVKSAWRRRSRQTHPDVGGDAVAFQEVQEAYQLLGDAEARARYDQRNATAGPRPHARSAASGSATSAGRARQAHRPGGFDGTRGPGAGGSAATPPPRPAPRPTMTVEPQHLSWAAHRVEGELRVVPHQVPWLRRVPLLGAVVAVVAWLWLVVSVFSATLAPGLADVAGVVLLGVFAVGVGTRWWPVGLAAGCGGVVTGWFAYYATGWVDVAAWVVALLAAFAAAGVRGARPLLVPSGLDELIPEESARNFNVFGAPGSPGHVDTGDKRAAARMGDDALLPLTWFPGTRTFHAAPFDDAGRAVSHVVVCGRRVAVVDTIAWLPGTYAFSPHGAVTCDGGHFVYGDTVIGDAVAAWQSRVPKGCEVRGWVMVGSPMGPVGVVHADGPGAERVGTPQQVVEEIGAWFADGDPTLVDRRVLFSVAKSMVA